MGQRVLKNGFSISFCVIWHTVWSNSEKMHYAVTKSLDDDAISLFASLESSNTVFR